jgi:molecular chaperone DnaK
VEINVTQGERAMSADNKSLGRFMLDGIPPAPRGMPQVEVTFDVDSNGILTVKAKEKTTGKEQSIRIEGSTGLSKEDIERMKADADAHAADDEKRKGLVDARNLADQMIYAAEKAIKDNGEKAGAEVVAEVQTKVSDLKAVKDAEDLDRIKSATDALSQSLSKIGEAMMKGQQAEQGGGQPPEAGTGPVDAEATEK